MKPGVNITSVMYAVLLRVSGGAGLMFTLISQSETCQIITS